MWWARALFRSRVDDFVPRSLNVNLRIDCLSPTPKPLYLHKPSKVEHFPRLVVPGEPPSRVAFFTEEILSPLVDSFTRLMAPMPSQWLQRVPSPQTKLGTRVLRRERQCQANGSNVCRVLRPPQARRASKIGSSIFVILAVIEPGLVGSTDFSFITSQGHETSLGGVPREQKMIKGHLLRVIYHRVYFNIRR